MKEKKCEYNCAGEGFNAQSEQHPPGELKLAMQNLPVRREEVQHNVNGK
jgi:hypothetical protein